MPSNKLVSGALYWRSINTENFVIRGGETILEGHNSLFGSVSTSVTHSRPAWRKTSSYFMWLSSGEKRIAPSQLLLIWCTADTSWYWYSQSIVIKATQKRIYKSYFLKCRLTALYCNYNSVPCSSNRWQRWLITVVLLTKF